MNWEGKTEDIQYDHTVIPFMNWKIPDTWEGGNTFKSVCLILAISLSSLLVLLTDASLSKKVELKCFMYLPVFPLKGLNYSGFFDCYVGFRISGTQKNIHLFFQQFIVDTISHMVHPK